VPGFNAGGFNCDTLSRVAGPAAPQAIYLDAEIVLGDGLAEGIVVRASRMEGGRQAIVGTVRKDIRNSNGTGLLGDIKTGVRK
jgi:hypothetical protein